MCVILVEERGQQYCSKSKPPCGELLGPLLGIWQEFGIVWDNKVGSRQIQLRNVLYSLYLDHPEKPLDIVTTGRCLLP